MVVDCDKFKVDHKGAHDTNLPSVSNLHLGPGLRSHITSFHNLGRPFFEVEHCPHILWVLCFFQVFVNNDNVLTCRILHFSVAARLIIITSVLLGLYRFKETAPLGLPSVHILWFSSVSSGDADKNYGP